jgi:hypothetical protein
MHHVWTGVWPANRCPRLDGIWLDGRTALQNIRLQPGQPYAAKVAASDPDHDSITYRWDVMEESTETKIGGDSEARPAHVPGLITDPRRSDITLQAPARPGAYRLFVYAYDNQGHAAHANIPFYVDDSARNQSAAAAPQRQPEAQP